jgi:hypothetical protein
MVSKISSRLGDIIQFHRFFTALPLLRTQESSSTFHENGCIKTCLPGRALALPARTNVKWDKHTCIFFEKKPKISHFCPFVANLSLSCQNSHILFPFPGLLDDVWTQLIFVSA